MNMEMVGLLFKSSHNSRFFENGRGDRIRTYDILLPKQARYQAALHPELS